MYINILINSITSTRALCDSGYQCFATVSEQFVKERGLDASSIQPRPLEQVTTTKNRSMVRKSQFLLPTLIEWRKRLLPM